MVARIAHRSPALSEVSQNIIEIALELDRIGAEINTFEKKIEGLLNRKWNLELRGEFLREQER